MGTNDSIETKGDLTRRTFLTGAAMAGVGGALFGLAACSNGGEGAGSGEAPTGGEPVVSTPIPAAASDASATVKAGYLSYFDWLGEEPKVDESKTVDTVAVDVIVVGGGNAGVPAALAAAEAGAKVAVLEKQLEAEYSFFGHDIGHLNSKWAKSKGGDTIDVAEFLQDWERRSMNRSNMELIRKYALYSGDTLDWILDHLPQEIIDGAGIFAVPKPSSYPGSISGYKCWSSCIHFEEVEGTTWKEAQLTLKSKAEEKGATWYFDCAGTVLTKEGGRVTGVIGTSSDGVQTRFTASKGVIVAAGDYAGNPDMIFAWNDEYRDLLKVRKQDYREIKGIGRTGDGQKMCCWAGGRMEPGPHASMGRANGAGAFGGIALLQLNRDGKRFMNEGILGVWGNFYQIMRQPLGTLYAVVDSTWRDYIMKNAAEHVYPGTGGYHDGGFLATLDEEIPKVLGTGTEGYKVRNCSTYAGETIEELADNMGLNGDVRTNFLASIERYNEVCRKGKDEDFGKDSFLLDPIDSPPFFATLTDNSRLTMGLVELGGVVTDGDQRVLDDDNQPIPGLFVTGNSCGGRFQLQYCTPIAGISIGLATTLGKLVGELVAKQ
jgi:hypothetical protein